MKRALLLLFLLSCAYDPQGVRYVIDGDTFVLNNGETIRLLGIDTPEKGDINYDRAGYELQRRLVGRQLTLEGDTDDNGYDHAGERASLWAFLRLGLDRGNVEEGEKGEDIDMNGFGFRIWPAGP